ncbi:tesmin [Numenius arquata]|uniref:tesmin n=1 Tax=Numenius arquata TaxID=31919 RepID=UPI003D30B46B
MENQILLDIRPVIDSGLVTEIFSQNSALSSENFSLETEVISNAFEEGLPSSQDNHLRTVNVGETLLDHLKYPLTIENQNTIVKVEVQPHGSNICDDEDLEKYKELNLPEEAEHMHPPYVPSNGLHFLSSVAMQHKNCSVPTSSIFSPEGTVDQNVRMLPAEVREAVSNIIENHQDKAILQSSNVDKSGCKLLTLHSVPEESRGSHRNDPKPVVICQLEGGTQILCINSCGTQELKPVHLIPEYRDQHNYLQSDVDNPVTSVPGQFLPIPGEPVLNEQEVKKLYPLKLLIMMTVAGSQDCGIVSGFLRYCDCFANGDFCNNCNCNNCYNSQLHESERFQAIKACLDRNPEAFLPKIGKGKLGEIKPHHNKGCNCKRSGCLKNYCQCFEAKIMCSSICKCIGCKNYEESAEEKSQLNVLNYMEIGNNEGNSPVLTSTFKTLPKLKTDRQPAVRVSLEEVKATCACLLVQAEEAEKRGYSIRLAEQMIMEEFGRCLSQILHA